MSQQGQLALRRYDPRIPTLHTFSYSAVILRVLSISMEGGAQEPRLFRPNVFPTSLANSVVFTYVSSLERISSR
jgi:hypothetical protein